jgi:hypothetical protein
MLTPKQNALRFIATLPDDVNYERILYHVGLMHAVEQAEADIKAGRYIDHDELFDRIEAEYAQSLPQMDRAGKSRSQRNSSASKPKRSTNSNALPKKAQKKRRIA